MHKGVFHRLPWDLFSKLSTPVLDFFFCFCVFAVFGQYMSYTCLSAQNEKNTLKHTLISLSLHMTGALHSLATALRSGHSFLGPSLLHGVIPSPLRLDSRPTKGWQIGRVGHRLPVAVDWNQRKVTQRFSFAGISSSSPRVNGGEKRKAPSQFEQKSSSERSGQCCFPSQAYVMSMQQPSSHMNW